MQVFLSTLSQMGTLFLYIAIGYIIAKVGIVNKDAAGILSKLENNIFIPALVFGTFMNEFTLETLSYSWKILLFSFGALVLVIPLAYLFSYMGSRDGYIRNIYVYGLCFANFGFMGNAVVKTLFPEYFASYLIFTLPLWTMIYVWGVPALLMADGEKKSLGASLKKLINPMFVALILGAVIGLSGIKLPSFMGEVVTVCGNCMSPIAMILTGITFSSISFKKVLTNLSLYYISFVRLVLMPLIFIGLLALIKLFVDIPRMYEICFICTVAMPLGLNTIVIPAAYGKDTTAAAGMALISHTLAVISIPILFLLIA